VQNPSPGPAGPGIDIFCCVVDNYGDIGVTWRLARQLVEEKGCAVRLIVDDLAVFAKLAPALDPARESQDLGGITVLHWTAALSKHYTAAADCVIEAFGCALPDFVITLMLRHKSVWLDLEYLSAEDWVEGCHAVVSLHPSTGLNKTLFFPGFTAGTGGLIREEKLLQKRDEFQGSVSLQNDWRNRIGLPPIAPKSLDISVFCYNFAPWKRLLKAVQGRRIRLFAPSEIAAGFVQQNLEAEIHAFPFLSQDDYDRLLWTCGLNLVRGEESFVRALWAGRPYVWQIYPQNENAHFIKLEAFLAYYSRNLAPDCAESLANFTRMWNLGGHSADALPGFFDQLSALSVFARQKAEEQALQDDLATQLLRFTKSQRH
jgi:uncharacterized repeat protein (TIGR03837 family)